LVTGLAALQPAGFAHRRIFAVGIGLLIGLAALIWFEPRWQVRLQSAWFDTYQILKSRDVLSTPVTVVQIDERSLARLGQWPWPRTVLAELIRKIEGHEPAAIGVDIVMPEPDRLSPERLLSSARQEDPVLASHLDALPSSDSELARAIAEGPVVLGLAGTFDRTTREVSSPPFVVVDRAPRELGVTEVAASIPRFAGALANIDELDRAAAGHGAISVGPTEEVIRRVPLVIRVAGQLVPAMSMEMLRVALHVPEVRLYARGPTVESIAVGDFVAPTDAEGEVRIYYSGRDARRFVSAIDVLDGKVDPLRMRQKLVLIGTTGIGMVDFQNTPLGERMPGTEIQAQLLENLFDQTWLTRPAWATWLELAVFVLLGISLIWATPRWKPAHAGLLALGCIVLPIAAGITAFLWRRLLFDVAAPALGLLVLFSVLLVLTLAEAGRNRRMLEHAISRQREEAAHVAGELEAAKRIQVGFLPRADLLRDDPRVDIAASMTPAREVGGDLYDYFLLGDNRLFFLIGDVAGKGLSASLFMAVSKALYKSTTLRNPHARVSEMMQAANDEVSRDNPESFFVTAFAGILDLESGDLTYSNAGHVNPYVLRPASDGLVQITDGAGPPLCAVDRFDYRSGHRRMRPNELICLVTDGVVDAQNPASERYGSGRLQAVIANPGHNGTSAREMVDAVCADVRGFSADAEPADDLTVLVLRWLGPSVGG
jgi:adenylate cyclase